MIQWPKHGQTIRDDELYLFAYCKRRWGNAAYADHSELQFAEVASRLNDRFQQHFGVYTPCALRHYIQRLRLDPKYRWPANGHKRYNQFAVEIDQYMRQNDQQFCLALPIADPVDINIKRRRVLSIVLDA
jgi:hypothetical protein